MVYINVNYARLNQSFFFTTVREKINSYKKLHPDREVMNLGIGDVTLPITPAVINAMKDAADELGEKETFRGYGPEEGYAFLKEAIRKYYLKNKVVLEQDEIFIGDGVKSDFGDIVDIFDTKQGVLIPNPVYPAYLDASIMSGYEISFAHADETNEFLPMPDQLKDRKPDLIYLCSPNNPTGAVYNRKQLAEWVEYARSINSVILFDAAYVCFIQGDEYPKSIYEIEGAKECAIEFHSLSKTAGFTGIRCGYTIVPKQLAGYGEQNKPFSLNAMWRRRQSTKFNGVSYVIQRATEAVFSEDGQVQIQENIKYYSRNAMIMREALKKMRFIYYGGIQSPYIWLKCKNGMDSWTFFDYLLENAAIIGTPGVGYGTNGEGFFRLTAFGSYDDTMEAMERMEQLFL